MDRKKLLLCFFAAACTIFVSTLVVCEYADIAVFMTPARQEKMRRDYRQQAINQLLPLAEKGDPKVQFRLAYKYYEQAQTAPSFYSDALKWYKKAADQGNTDAEVNLGSLYLNGQGVEKNEIQAVRFFKLAAENGNAAAQSNLALMYLSGIGLEQNSVSAIYWFEKAMAQNYVNPEALKALHFTLRAYKLSVWAEQQ